MELTFFGFLNKLGNRLSTDGLGKLVCGGFLTFFGASEFGKAFAANRHRFSSIFDVDF